MKFQLSKILQILIQYQNFKFKLLHSAIKAKQLGKGEDKIMKDKLSTLKNKIINNSNGTVNTEFESNWNKLYKMTLKLELLELKNN